ncbi:MAG: peptide deformylase [Clostridia bacterium]|nr:MAG: peptide deformylase [Clostridia bacterium]
MAVYRILRLGAEILREEARPVPKITDSILRLLDNMAETMYQANGVGLAAPQIGVSKRVVVVDAGEGLIGLVNPVVVTTAGEDIAVEGCLSIPGVEGEVKRASLVKVSGWDRSGREVEVEGSGLLARVLQHEIDHLDGILFIDKVIRFVEQDKGRE